MTFNFLHRLMRRRAQLSIEDAQARRAILILSGYLVAIFALHIGAMMAFEKMSFGTAVWLTATTVTTVGYGDVSAASTAGRASTFFLLYVGGIFALAKGAGDYFDYRASRRQRMLSGRWRWDMEDHVLLVNVPSQGAVAYFDTLYRIDPHHRFCNVGIKSIEDGFAESRWNAAGDDVDACPDRVA